MRCFEIDLSHILKIILLNKETLGKSRQHCTRYNPEYILYAVTEGELYLEESGREITLVPGDIYIFKKGDFQKPIKEATCKYYYVHFETDAFTEYEMTDEEYYSAVKEKKTEFLKSNKLNAGCYDYMRVILRQENRIENKGFFEYFTGVLENNIFSHKSLDIEKRMNISNVVATLFLKLEDETVKLMEKSGRKSAKTYHTVHQIAGYITENYKSDVGGQDIEREFFLNYDYANRIFKKIMGCSILNYRNQVRINAAKVSLLTTGKTLDEIADETGFYDKSYLSRVFKKYEGITPGEYREKILMERHKLKGE